MNNIYKKNSKIIEEDNKKYFIKKSEKNIQELFEYLNLRSFENIPDIIDTKHNEYKYQFVEESDINNKNKYLELAKIVSSLHYKTAYYKDVSKDKYREIYEKLSNKIEYMSEYYNSLITKLELEVFPSPAHYLILRNYSVINGGLNYSKNELKKWFKLVENKTKERVVIVHNNIKLEHLIKGDKYYLTNWDNYMVDTPILDLYKIYKERDVFNNFMEFYKEYNSNFSLSNEESKLFSILISIPPKIEEVSPEISNCKNIRSIVNKLYRTNELVGFINSKKEIDNKSY